MVAGLLSLIAVSVAAIVALPSGNGQNVVAVTTGSFGVIGTVVGAYFGVKLGADRRQAAQHAQRAEAAKVQALAAHLDSDEADRKLKEARRQETEGGPAADAVGALSSALSRRRYRADATHIAVPFRGWAHATPASVVEGLIAPRRHRLWCDS